MAFKKAIWSKGKTPFGVLQGNRTQPTIDMKLLSVKFTRAIYPPFKSTVYDLVNWVRPISVLLRSSESVIGGCLVSPNVIATTLWEKQEKVVALVNGEKFTATYLNESMPDLALSFYKIEQTGWVGLPNRKDPLEHETYLFSYLPCIRERVICFEPIPSDKSQVVKSLRSGLKLDSSDVEYTLPVVDRFGYFVGLAIGSSLGEVIVQPFFLRRIKL